MHAVKLKRDWAELTISYDPIFIDPEFEKESFDFMMGQDWPVDMVSVDVGGHQGIWTTFLAKLRPKGVVYTFEPHPVNFPYLVSNIRSNGIANVLLSPCALGSKNEPSLLRCWDPSLKMGALGTCQLIKGDLPHYELPVEVRMLDSFEITGVDFIKIDVEHWEYEVLQGALETIINDRPRILVETHNEDTPRQIRDMCVDLNYEATYRQTHVPSLNLKSDDLWLTPK